MSQEGKNVAAEEMAGTVAGKISEIIEGVLGNMRELIGPLTPEEESHIRTTLAYEATTVLIRRLELNNFIGHGADE